MISEIVIILSGLTAGFVTLWRAIRSNAELTRLVLEEIEEVKKQNSEVEHGR